MNVEGFAVVGSIAVLLFVWGALDMRYKKQLVKLHTRMLSRKIVRLQFVHSFYVGKDRHAIKGENEKMFWADATFSVLIRHRKKPAAIIGFELSKETLTVCQLQGLKGAYVGDLDLGVFLLQCAERIARTLQKKVIRVQPAYLHTYFDLDDTHRLYPQLYAHQARLRQMYDVSAKTCGYTYHRPGYFYWHEKHLRKRISFRRFLRLQLLLFNRNARTAYRNSREELFTASD